MQTITEAAVKIADQGGYSADRYANWEDVAQTLLNMGFSPKEAEAIMRSKWTRWAADDHDAKYSQVPADALVEWLDRNGMNPGDTEVADLVEQTFG